MFRTSSNVLPVLSLYSDIVLSILFSKNVLSTISSHFENTSCWKAGRCPYSVDFVIGSSSLTVWRNTSKPLLVSAATVFVVS